MKKMSLLFSATALLLTTAMPASAVTLLYSFAPTTAGVQMFTFNVDSNPVASSTDLLSFTTSVTNLTVGGTIAGNGTASATFQPLAGSDGGLGINVFGIGDYFGPQLFSGPARTPTLLTGSFALYGGPNNAAGTLTVSSVVPEPATWAMMAIGFALAGSAMRRRKVTTRVAYAVSHH